MSNIMPHRAQLTKLQYLQVFVFYAVRLRQEFQ